MKNTSKTNPYEKTILVIKSHVRNWFKLKGFRMNDLTTRAVNDAVIEILEKAIVRTKLSGRKTVYGRDV